MNSTGKKLISIAAGDARPTPTAATSRKLVCAMVYAGATLDVAITVVSKRFRVFAFRCEAAPAGPACAAGVAIVAIVSSCRDPELRSRCSTSRA